MLLKHKQSGQLVEVLDLFELTSPTEQKLVACLQWDEELPDARCYDKQELCFPSGETLPQCWIHIPTAGPKHLEQGAFLHN
jgi:hypothetical protein